MKGPKMSKATFAYDVKDHRTLTLNPIDDSKAERVIDIEFTARTRSKEGEDDKVQGWWRARCSFTFDGQETVVEGTASKPQAALESCLKNIPGAALDQYEAVDFDNDFYKQKLEAPAEKLVDYAIEVDSMSLADLRADMERTFVTIEENEDSALDGAITIGRQLCEVRAALGGDMKKLEAFVRGEGLGDNAGNMPHLARLGNGKNAIKEACRFGEAHANLIRVVGPKTTSGKGLEDLKSKVQLDFVKAAARAYLSVCRKEGVEHVLPVTVKAGDKTMPGFDAPSAARFLKALLYAKEGFNIDNAMELSLADVPDAADARAEAYTIEFLANGGKRYNSYNENEFAAIKKAFGFNLFAWEGSELPGAHTIRLAADAIAKLDELETAKVPDDEAIDRARASLIGKRTNALMHFGAVEVAKMLAENEAAEEQRRKLEEAENEDTPQLVNQKTLTAFTSLDVTEATARIFAMVAKHPKYLEIFENCLDLAKAKAKADADKAEAEADKIAAE